MHIVHVRHPFERMITCVNKAANTCCTGVSKLLRPMQVTRVTYIRVGLRRFIGGQVITPPIFSGIPFPSSPISGKG
jgi:hypothetical protein